MKKTKLRISFDFDRTLDMDHIQDLFLELQATGLYDMYIVTRRRDEEMTEVYAVADSLDLDHMKVYNTNYEYKYPTLEMLDIDLHIDDDYHECIQSPVGEVLRVFCYLQPYWKTKYLSILEALQTNFKQLNNG